MTNSYDGGTNVATVHASEELPTYLKRPLPPRQRIKSIVWDSLDRSPEERKFIAKIDFFILTWAGFTYFSKNLNTNNICESRNLIYRDLHTFIDDIC